MKFYNFHGSSQCYQHFYQQHQKIYFDLLANNSLIFTHHSNTHFKIWLHLLFWMFLAIIRWLHKFAEDSILYRSLYHMFFLLVLISEYEFPSNFEFQPFYWFCRNKLNYQYTKIYSDQYHIHNYLSFYVRHSENILFILIIFWKWTNLISYFFYFSLFYKFIMEIF